MGTSKELKAEYKQMKFKMGVFCIRNTTNGKIYISSSTDLVAAWNSQKFQLEAGLHPNDELQRDWNMLGSGSFSYSILDEIPVGEDPEEDYAKEVRTLEEMLIDELQPYGDKGYNRMRR